MIFLFSVFSFSQTVTLIPMEPGKRRRGAHKRQQRKGEQARKRAETAQTKPPQENLAVDDAAAQCDKVADNFYKMSLTKGKSVSSS